MAFFKLLNISKKYQNQTVLDDISFSLPRNGLIVIKGKSGCGKSTLLNIIFGIAKPDKGKILINNKNITKLKDKKVVLNKSLLNAQDVMEFEYESRLTILYNIPPLDEKNDDIYTMKAFLETIGFHRIDTSDAVEKKDKILGIF